MLIRPCFEQSLEGTAQEDKLQVFTNGVLIRANFRGTNLSWTTAPEENAPCRAQLLTI